MVSGRPDGQTVVHPGLLPRVEVRIDARDDVRAAVFLELEGLPDRQRAAVARRIAAVLRAGGFLADGLEVHLNATTMAGKISRTPEFVVKECKAGRFGRVYRDDGGWLIPVSGGQAWLERRIFGISEGTP